LINESDAEIEKILKASANPGVAATKVEQYYATQVKQFRALNADFRRAEFNDSFWQGTCHIP
jgi:hypothetical protein